MMLVRFAPAARAIGCARDGRQYSSAQAGRLLVRMHALARQRARSAYAATERGRVARAHAGCDAANRYAATMMMGKLATTGEPWNLGPADYA